VGYSHGRSAETDFLFYFMSTLTTKKLLCGILNLESYKFIRLFWNKTSQQFQANYQLHNIFNDMQE